MNRLAGPRQRAARADETSFECQLHRPCIEDGLDFSLAGFVEQFGVDTTQRRIEDDSFKPAGSAVS